MKLHTKGIGALLLFLSLIFVWADADASAVSVSAAGGIPLFLPGRSETEISFNDEDYSQNDVAVMNQVIQNNGLNAEESDPEAWATAGLVTWDNSSPKKITKLILRYKELTGRLDVSGLQNLQYLDCSVSQLTDLNVSGLQSLQTLYCGRNRLTGLDLSGLKRLLYLDCGDNRLVALDLSDQALLRELKCPSNQLTDLNVSGLKNLGWLDCTGNRLKELDVIGLQLLQTLYCSENRLTVLDVSGLERLQYLNCSRNDLTELNVAGLESLLSLECPSNRLTELNVAGLKSLNWLDCSRNQLAELDISGLLAMTTLGCSDNRLTELDLSGLENLRYLDCYHNLLTTLNISGLYEMDIQDNPFTSLQTQGGHTLTVGKTEGGTVQLNSFDRASVTLTAIPDEQHVFTEWKGLPENVSASGKPAVTFRLTGDTVASAVFQAADGWHQNDTGQWLYYENNRPSTGWKRIAGKWCYFDAAGLMQNGFWMQSGSRWIYFTPEGSIIIKPEING